MIILQGPDETLRRELFNILTEGGDEVNRSATKEPYRADIGFFTAFIHTDHRLHVRDQLLHGLRDGDAARYMLGMGLAAAGSLVVLCGADSREEVRSATFGGLLPALPVSRFSDLNHTREMIVDAWRLEREKVDPLYDYWSSGGRPDQATMLVGESNQDLNGRKRRAFISHTGCSLFLHQALQANPFNRYYLTNAGKGETRKYNMVALEREIELVKPRRIVALGGVAAAYLSDLKVTFERTYHPNYWKRFKNKDLDELAGFLK